MRHAASLRSMQQIATALLAISVFVPAPAATFKVLHNFKPAHGSAPKGGLAIDAEGNLYGTTSEGGKFNFGTVFKFANGHVKTIHNFEGGADGATPLGRLLFDRHGDIYGTTLSGGVANAGTLFRVKRGQHYEVIATLAGGAEGSGLKGGVAEASDGTLYTGSGSNGIAPGGALLAFRPPLYRPSAIFSFTGLASDGGPPISEPILFGDRLMGTGFNTIYSIAPDGRGFLNYSVPGNYDQEQIYAGLTPDGQGNLWGVMLDAYYQNQGMIYVINPNGSLTYKFDLTSDAGIFGQFPSGTLVRAASGVLYGTTQRAGRSPNGDLAEGTVFSYDPESGIFSTVYAFPVDGSNGGEPFAGLVQDAAGRLYGITSQGGKFGGGTLFRIDP